MKVVGKQEEILWEGDQITCDITHEILIAGDRSWVKYGAQSRVRPGETTETAQNRVTKHVDEGAMAAVQRVVDTTRKAAQ